MGKRGMCGSRAVRFLALAAVLVGSALGRQVASAQGAPAPAPSELRELVERYGTDRSALLRRYPVERSPRRVARLQAFYAEWKGRLAALDFEGLGLEGRVDHILLRNEIGNEAKLLGRYEGGLAGAAPLVPFGPAILGLNDARLEMESLDAAKAAAVLDALARQVEATRRGVEAAPGKTDKLAAFRAQEAVEDLKKVLESWYQFYAGYDPLFTWWAAVPQKKVVTALDDYRKALREKVLGVKAQEDDPIVGTPIGREALVSDLASELIPYTPEDLLAIADREFAWCEAEMKKAAREMGLGDDWKAAVERVKALHVEPGQQPALIRDLAREAEAYLEEHGLLTIPPLAREVWRIQMMTPERQKVNPFFTGGEVISVSFPTDTMEHADKLMSLRGNNVHFARATVHHELIPGHHLQGFMTQRYNAHRRVFQTAFWGEGWALYWEMVLWDRGFPKTPENRIGMLFWRMHRAARIVFSLRFHLGTMTAPECVDFLVERVGHEPANAAAEVRRSFNGSYAPLYQLAYMMGGLQFKALHGELVGSGKMTDRQFHDAVLAGGPMPVELVRARLVQQALKRDHRASWKYAGGSPAGGRAAESTVVSKGSYGDLVTLFAEWREFQKPRLRDGVPDYTPAAMAEQRRRLPGFQARLQAFGREGWPVARQVDWHLLRAEMNGLDFDHRVLRPWSRDPAFYAPIIPEQSDTPSKEGRAFAGAIEAWRLEFPLSAAALASFTAQLRAIPPALAQARANLVEDARDLWWTGIRVHREQAARLGALARRVAPHHPALVPEIERARAAEDEFRAWLEAALPAKRGPSGVGVAHYDWYLRHVHLSPYTWRDEVTLHERELARSLAHLALERSGRAEKPGPAPIDSPEEWARRMQEAVSAYMKFLGERGVGTVKDYMDPALRARVSSFVPPDRRDFFSQIDAREPLLLRSHGYHWFDLARMEKEPHPSPIRRVPLLYNIWDSRAEGLATGMEETMASLGLFEGRPGGRELMYVMVAQRAARGLASLLVHANEMGIEEAVRFAHQRTPYGWLKVDGDLVWGEQRLYLEQPGYGTCYLSGKAQIERLLADRARQQGEAFTLKRFVDDLNGAGLIPVSMIRWELTGLDDEVKRLE